MESRGRALHKAAGRVAASLALATVLYSCRPASAERSAIAVPAVREREALDACLAEGLSVTTPSTIRVPLSDFSKIVSIPASEALARALPGDPRRTPFLDELERRLSAIDAAGARWCLLYADDPGGARAITAVLDRAGLPWIGMASPGTPRRTVDTTPLALVPALLWGLWLVARPRRTGPRRAVVHPGSSSRFTRTYRIRIGIEARELGLRLVAIACAWPLFVPLRLGSTALGVAIMTLFVAIDEARARGRAGRSVLAALWPAGFLCVAVAVVAVTEDASVLAYAGASAILRVAFARARAWLSGRSERHAAPVFSRLARRGAAREAGALALASSAPVLGLLVMAWALAEPSVSDPACAGLEFGERLGVGVARRLLTEHLEYQRALTYGRLGEAKIGELGYTPVIRFTEENGRVRLASVDEASVTEPGSAADEAGLSPALGLLGRRTILGVGDACP